MTEYEYSSEVEDIEPFIQYCKENGYELLGKTLQTRILYKNNDGILARITINEIGDKVYTHFDFKHEMNSKGILKESEESPIIELTDNNKAFILYILKTFGFNKIKELKRIRYEYVNADVKFEIDDYEQPKMQVVAIEGNKEQVDMTYEKIKYLYDKINM